MMHESDAFYAEVPNFSSAEEYYDREITTKLGEWSHVFFRRERGRQIGASHSET